MFPVALGVEDVLSVDPGLLALDGSGVGLEMGVAEPRDADGLYEKGGRVGNSVADVSEDEREDVAATEVTGTEVAVAVDGLETQSDEGVGREAGKVGLTMTLVVLVLDWVYTAGRPESNMEDRSGRSMVGLADVAGTGAALFAT